jgi:hypothetical protein
MVLTYFDKIVYYQICDFMYDEFESQKNNKAAYQTFSSMCGVIGQKIKVGAELSKKERGLVNILTVRLVSFFGFNDDECLKYLFYFFKDEFWVKYQGSVCEINVFFRRAKNI